MELVAALVVNFAGVVLPNWEREANLVSLRLSLASAWKARGVEGWGRGQERAWRLEGVGSWHRVD